MNKAVSPFIAVILLLAFVIATGTIVTLWGTGLFTTTKSTVEEKVTNFTTNCAVGLLEINKVYCSASSGGLVGYWKFNENSGGSAADSSGQGNTGTLTNMNTTGNATSGWNSTDCKFGNCLKFDGANDYVDAGTAASLDLGNSDFTVMGWVKRSSTGTEDRQLIAKYDRDLDRANYEIYWTSSDCGINILGSRWTYNGGSWVTICFNETATETTDTGIWYHFALVHSGNKMYSYLNGSYKQERNLTGTIDSVTNYYLAFGNRPGYGQYFNGTIDEVAIYNRALSAQEIQRVYQQGVSVRASVTNIGSSNLGKEFILTWTANSIVNSSIVTLSSDLTPASTQWISQYNITESGALSEVKVTSKACPTVVKIKKVSDQAC